MQDDNFDEYSQKDTEHNQHGEFLCGFEEEKYDPLTGEKIIVKC